MNVMVRVREPSRKQYLRFGDSCFRPFITIRNVDDENEIRSVVRAVLFGRRPPGVKIHYIPYFDEKMEYSILGSGGFGEWRELEV